MSIIDKLLANNATFAVGFAKGGAASLPAKKLAVLTCMDSRLDVFSALGLDYGDAHVIRNAGGAVTDDVIRSLAISQHVLGTDQIVVIHHTDCGMMKFTDDAFARRLRDEVGTEPTWAAQTFTHHDDSIRRSIARLKDDPFIPHTDNVRGFVYDVTTGVLREVV